MFFCVFFETFSVDLAQQTNEETKKERNKNLKKIDKLKKN